MAALRRGGGAEERGRLERDAYTYLHIPIVYGIIASAVGLELVIAHPGEALEASGLIVLAAGPVLYLLGHVGFRLWMVGTLYDSGYPHMIASVLKQPEAGGRSWGSQLCLVEGAWA